MAYNFNCRVENKIQSKTAYFSPMPPSGAFDQATSFDVQLVPSPDEVDDIYVSSLILAH